MNKRWLLLFILIAIPLVEAKDITLSLDQKDYYFKTGEDAVLNLKSENSYSETVNGLLSYTITQSINQGNFQYSSSNTKSTSFSVDKGENEIPISFGTSDTPMTLSIGLEFSYTKDGAREVILDDIKIHFVSDDSQKNNQQNKVSSSSQKSQTPRQQSGPFAQQEQRMQQMMDEMFRRQQQQPQNAQQRLQNNQLSQDSSALKQQMQKQIQEQQQMKEEFQKQLAQNQDFQEQHQELLKQGYDLTNANFNPSSNNTGDFELNYQKQNGEQASLKGRMQNGEMQDFQKDTAESRQKMLEQLQQNKQFQKYQDQLQKQGFQHQNAEFFQELNKTSIQVNYINQNNETASIKAEIVNNTVENVELVNETEKEKKNYLWIILVATLLSVLGYLAYKKLAKKPQENKTDEKKIVEKAFDYKSEALLMLEKAKELFEKKEYKEAYGKAGQALRLFLNYENDLKKETTNDEIISHLRHHKKQYKDAKDCFDLCSLVEFAKYQANKKDFEKIINYASKIIQ